MAEGMLRALGGQRFRALSAGIAPADAPDPLALETLQRMGFAIEGLRSKSWQALALAHGNAPALDVVITLCEGSAEQARRILPGAAVNADWPLPDPAMVAGSNRQRIRAFGQAAAMLRDRIELLVALPVHKLDAFTLALHLKDIGRENLLDAMR